MSYTIYKLKSWHLVGWLCMAVSFRAVDETIGCVRLVHFCSCICSTILAIMKSAGQWSSVFWFQRVSAVVSKVALWLSLLLLSPFALLCAHDAVVFMSEYAYCSPCLLIPKWENQTSTLKRQLVCLSCSLSACCHYFGKFLLMFLSLFKLSCTLTNSFVTQCKTIVLTMTIL